MDIIRVNNDPSKWRTSKRVKEYLDRIDEIPHRSEGEAVLLEFIPKKTHNVLDLGTGNGRLIKLLRAKIPNIKSVGLDFSSHMIRELKKEFVKNKYLMVIEHDLNFPLPENIGKFDVVVSSLAIHHLTYDRKKELYSEVFSMLRPGGVFCNLDHISSHSSKLNAHFRKAIGRKAPNKEHINRLTNVETQLEWLREIGYVDVDCYWKWLEFALLIGFKSSETSRIKKFHMHKTEISQK